MAGKNGLQLLPEIKRRVDIKQPGSNKFLYVGALVLALVLVASYFVNSYRSSLESQLSDLNNELLLIERSRDKKAEKNLQIISGQLAIAATRLRNHLFWSEGFAKIENLLKDEVQIITLSADITGSSITFKAVTTSYTSLARQVAAFLTDEGIEDVSLGEARVKTDGKLEFSMILNFDSDIFIKK